VPLLTPLDELQLPDTLSGVTGINRADRKMCQLNANDDLSAIKSWLNEYRDSAQTFRNYQKEVERLLLWSLTERNKALSSLNRDDFIAYEQFIADPKPAEKWCGNRYSRQSEKWRPFQGPLKPQSQRQALVIIQSLMSYLVVAGYLSANPLALRRRQLPKTKNDENTIERYLDNDLWEFLYKYVTQQTPNTLREKAHHERERYLITMLYLLTPRVSEIANHTMGSIREREGKWWWHVTGKGNTTHRVPVNQAMMSALSRYRKFHGLAPQPIQNETTPLIMSLNGNSNVTANMIYRVVKKFLTNAAEILEKTDPEKAEKLRQASTHWFRHTGLTHQLNSGIDLRHVNKNARHAKLETTGIYIHAEDNNWHLAMESHSPVNSNKED